MNSTTDGSTRAESATAPLSDTQAPERRRRSILGPIVLVVGVVGPIAGLVVLVALVPDSLRSAAPPATVVTMPVQITKDDKPQAVQASLNWRSGPTLLAPNWSGLVTAVDIRPGQRITSGTPIVTIDGIRRIALASPQPFYRQIRPGVAGGDVQALRTALARLGLGSVGFGTTYDATLKAAIQRLNARLEGTSVSSASGVFDPSWVIYLPAEYVSVASLNFQLGAAPPPPGQAVVTSQRTLKPFRLVASSSQGVPASLPPISAGYVLVLRTGTIVPVGQGFAISTPRALAKVTSALGSGASSLAGVIRLASASSLSTVPSTAVVSDASGTYCVFAPVGKGLKAYVVTPAGGLPGVTEVTGLPKSIQSVVANPDQVAAGLSCK